MADADDDRFDFDGSLPIRVAGHAQYQLEAVVPVGCANKAEVVTAVLLRDTIDRDDPALGGSVKGAQHALLPVDGLAGLRLEV